MAKYSTYSRRPPPKMRPWKIHPVWRGIGCIMLIIIPILAYAGAVLLVEANMNQRWVPVPGEFIRSVNIPFLGNVHYFYATLLTTIILVFIGFGGLMIFYALIYRLVGPPSLGPLDAPPERPSNKKRR